MKFYAHSGRDALGKLDLNRFQSLAEHLRGVAVGASGRAATVNLPLLAELAFTAGLLHDLGKYRSEFQNYIRDLPPLGEKKHKEAGAAVAYERKQVALAMAIAGHHGGIPDKADMESAVKGPNGKAVVDKVWAEAVQDCAELSAPVSETPKLANGHAWDLYIRVLFSCLVDADWADTGRHDRAVRGLSDEPEPPALDASKRFESVRAYIDGLGSRRLEPHVRKAREHVLNACLTATAEPTGLFSLTVPTGGGKTLASLAFALKHAAKNNLRRVIYVAPYMTILEQNVDVVRKALGIDAGDPAVFAHYSLAEPPDDGNGDETTLGSTARRAENWDAPVIVTTNVQFFESLFSNKPGRCRKLHNIARSVIILDECQTLPPSLAAPTCGMLKQLTTDLGSSVVLCTATQPAFSHPLLKEGERLDPTEIIPKDVDLFSMLKRVHVAWPKQSDAPFTWSEVANEMRNYSSALCVVNTKKAARAVYDELIRNNVAGVFHLSTGMCPQHRREKLLQIRGLLNADAPCFVVSTQLIEAGVDVDFPFVMREMAPLEAVIQAAGRCNREGKLAGAGGRVMVFRSAEAEKEPRKFYPQDEWYLKGRSVLETDFLNDDYEPRIDRPEDISLYYRKLYQAGKLDKHCIQAKRLEDKYATISDDYKLIKDDTVPVVVETWESHRAEIAALLSQIEKEKRPGKALFRRLALFQVNMWRRDLDRLWPHTRPGPKDLLVWTSKYEDAVGIVEEIGWDAIV